MPCVAKLLAVAALQAGAAMVAVAPEPFVALTWGRGPGQVGGRAQDPSIGEGIPAAFQVSDGVTWVLDSVNGRLLRLDARMQPAEPIGLRGPDRMAANAHGTDLAVATGGTMAVADGSAGSVLVLARDGAVRARMGPFSEVGRVEWTLGGHLAVHDQGRLEVAVFEPSGRRVRTVAHPDVTPFESSGGFLLGRTVLGEAYVVGRLEASGPRTVARLEALPASGGVLGGEVLGLDARRRIYVRVVEGHPDAVAGETLYRLDESGAILGRIRVAPFLGRYLTLRRTFRVIPDGRIAGFEAGPGGFTIHAYRFDPR